MTEASAPFTPPECNLKDFAFMPLDVITLRDSDLAATASGDEFRAAVLLWCASWHQVPAASLPDDDKVLAALAGYGRVVKEWMKVRENALRGFVRCSDGRLYHPVVAAKAREAWQSKLVQRWRTECARIKKHNQRHRADVAYPTFEAFVAGGCRPVALAMSSGTDDDCPGGQGEKSPPDPEGRSVQGTGIGTETGKNDGDDAAGEARGGDPLDDDPATWDLVSAAHRIGAAGGINMQRHQRLSEAVDCVKAWSALGLSFVEQRDLVLEAVLGWRDDPPTSLNAFDRHIRHAVAKRAGGDGKPARSPGRRERGLGMAEPALNFEQRPEDAARLDATLQTWENEHEPAGATH